MSLQEEIMENELPVKSNLRIVRKRDFHIVSESEFKQLDDDERNGESYEEFLEAERAGWADVVRSVLRKPYETVDSLPVQRPFRNEVKRVSEEKIQLQKQLATMFDREIGEERIAEGEADCDEV